MSKRSAQYEHLHIHTTNLIKMNTRNLGQAKYAKRQATSLLTLLTRASKNPKTYK